MAARSTKLTNLTVTGDLLVGGDLTYGNTYWDDIFVPLVTSKVGANAKPDFDFTNVGFLFPQNDATEILYFAVQLPHRWKQGSDVYPHVHWRQSAATIPVFKLAYKWYNIGAAPPADFTVYTMGTLVNPYVSGTIHQISYNATHISGAGKTMSSMLICKLYRDDNVVTGDLLTDQFDIHHEIDSPGSREEYVK